VVFVALLVCFTLDFVLAVFVFALDSAAFVTAFFVVASLVLILTFLT